MARVWMIRHGETEWALAGRHTGRTDLPLTERGREQARALRGPLAGLVGRVDAIWSSPLARARETAELAGLAPTRVVDDLAEWDYGEYEGLSTAELREREPGWSIWTTDIQRGESLDDVARRADRLVEQLARAGGEIVAVAHGHLLRILAVRWVGLEPVAARTLSLDTASVSLLEIARDVRVIRHWNAPAAGVMHDAA
ncbi:MAG TPA: histidine phosphatase family protein [Gammaproteobacteria bacterium]|nr:histidine phosphatase family protein [Gammaproteobacteria bacterium]